VLPSFPTRRSSDLVAFASRQHLRQRALARPVRPHDGMHLPGVDRQVDSFEDFVIVYVRVQVFDFQYAHVRYPTLPSKLMLSNFCASTANSIGDSWNTCRQNPLMIME